MPGFTDQYIKNLPAQTRRYEVYSQGERGFGIRVSTNGTKTFITRFRDRDTGKLVRYTIGVYDPDGEALTLAEARRIHLHNRREVTAGRNPHQEKLLERTAEREAITVDELAEEFVARYIARERKRPAEAARMLKKDVLPRIGLRKAQTLTKLDVSRVLDRIVDRGSPIMANRVGALVRQMLEFGVDRGHLDRNPFPAARKVSIGGRERHRTRYLDDTEIRTFWLGLDKINATPAMRIALKLLLLTGQRAGELTNAEKRHVDLDAALWTIPAASLKTSNHAPDEAHQVPLVPQTLRLFTALLEVATAGPYVLPSPAGNKPILRESLTRVVSRNYEVMGLAKFSPHDLRRTMVTHMNAMAIPHHVIERTVNHKLKGMERVYNQHNYLDERRDALSAWADRIDELTRSSFHAD